MNPEMDASDLIPLEPVGSIEYEPAGPHDYAWDVSVLHDHDGYAVGLSLGRPQMCLTPEEANRLGIGLLRAAAMGVAWERVRSRAN
jgi:hypothetical protein